MIEVVDLVKRYGDREVLHGLNFSVGAGRVCGFLGPNGSGKSTTMDILAGLLGPSSGIAKICGFDVVKQEKDVKKILGYLPDSPPLYKEMKVLEFVTHVAKLRDIDARQRKSAIENVMEQCDVMDVRNRIIGNLSKGYRQRVALCSALIHNPRVLILDEPTEGLDPNQILHIRNLIKKLAVERTVILSSHILSEVQATCDEVVIINKGKIAAKLNMKDNENRPPFYVYTFAGKAQPALLWFQQRNYIKSAKINFENPDEVIVEFGEEFWSGPKTSSIANVTEQLVSQGFSPIGIVEKKEGLEELFFDIIRAQTGETRAKLLLSGEEL